MRFLFAILFASISLICEAQTQPPIIMGSKLYQFGDGIRVPGALFIPRKDTPITDATMVAPGMILWRTIDQSFYGRDSTGWRKFVLSGALSDYVPVSRSINTTSPLFGGGNLSADRTISIANAAADGSTKGAASFAANDFNSSSGNISIDYTNGQAASSSAKGFLTSSDWTTFNNKAAGSGDADYIWNGTSAQTADFNISGGGKMQRLTTSAGSGTVNTVTHWELLNNSGIKAFSIGLLNNNFRLLRYDPTGAITDAVMNVSSDDGRPYFYSAVTMLSESRIRGIVTDSNAVSNLQFFKRDTTMRWGFVGAGSQQVKDIMLKSDSGRVSLIEATNQTFNLASDAATSSVPLIAPSPSYSSGGRAFVVRNATTGRFETYAPTSLSGYDITDAVTTNTTQTVSGSKTFSATTTTISGGNLSLTNGTSNFLLFPMAGQGAPATTTRSVGTRVVLSPTISASTVDYALGIQQPSGNTFAWFSMPSNTATHKLQFYGATSAVAQINGLGQAAFGKSGDPAATVDIQGSSSSTGTALAVKNSTPANLLQVDNNGEVTLFGGAKIITGSGSPEGAKTANVGSIYLRTDGTAGNTMYVKESGTGNTGWMKVTTSAP